MVELLTDVLVLVAVLCVVAELVVDDVAVDTVVELLTDVLVTVLCVVAELVVDDVAVDTVVELLTDVLVLVTVLCVVAVDTVVELLTDVLVMVLEVDTLVSVDDVVCVDEGEDVDVLDVLVLVHDTMRSLNSYSKSWSPIVRRPLPLLIDESSHRLASATDGAKENPEQLLEARHAMLHDSLTAAKGTLVR